jgi:hypothetical protein
MNQIYTGYVNSPLTNQPLTGPSIAFLQSATTEVIAAIVQNIIQSDTVSFTTPYALYGCKKTSLGGGNYSYTAGYIFYKGEIFSFPGISSIAIPDTDVVKITITNDPIADPIKFTDLVFRNVHNHRTLVLSDGLSGSGDFNFNSIVYLIQPKVRLSQGIADFSFYTGTHTITTLTTPNDGITRTYLIQISVNLKITSKTGTAHADCSLEIKQGSSVMATVEMESWTNTPVQNVAWPANVQAIATLGPNTAIDFNVIDTVSNGGTQVVTGLASMIEL